MLIIETPIIFGNFNRDGEIIFAVNIYVVLILTCISNATLLRMNKAMFICPLDSKKRFEYIKNQYLFKCIISVAFFLTVNIIVFISTGSFNLEKRVIEGISIILIILMMNLRIGLEFSNKKYIGFLELSIKTKDEVKIMVLSCWLYSYYFLSSIVNQIGFSEKKICTIAIIINLFIVAINTLLVLYILISKSRRVLELATDYERVYTVHKVKGDSWGGVYLENSDINK